MSAVPEGFPKAADVAFTLLGCRVFHLVGKGGAAQPSIRFSHDGAATIGLHGESPTMSLADGRTDRRPVQVLCHGSAIRSGYFGSGVAWRRSYEEPTAGSGGGTDDWVSVVRAVRFCFACGMAPGSVAKGSPRAASPLRRRHRARASMMDQDDYGELRAVRRTARRSGDGRRSRVRARRRRLAICALLAAILLGGLAWSVLPTAPRGVPGDGSMRELALGVPTSSAIELATLGDVDTSTVDLLMADLERRGVEMADPKANGRTPERVLHLVASSSLRTAASLVPSAKVVSSISPLSPAEESRLTALQGAALRLVRTAAAGSGMPGDVSVQAVLEWAGGEVPAQLTAASFPAVEFGRLNQAVLRSGLCRCALIDFGASMGQTISPQRVFETAAPAIPRVEVVSAPRLMLTENDHSTPDGPDPATWSDDLGDWVATTRTPSRPDAHIPLYRRSGTELEFVGDALTGRPPWAEEGPIWWAPSFARIGQRSVLFFTAQRDPGSRCIGAAVRREAEEHFDPVADPVICGDLHDPSVIEWDGSPWLLFASPASDGWELVSMELDPASLIADTATRTRLLKAEAEWQTDLQGNKRVENPNLVRLPGAERLMLLFSGGDWTTDGYATGVAWCWSPQTVCELDPAGSPLLQNGDTRRGRVNGIGGASVVSTRGSSVELVAHAYLDRGGSRRTADRVPLLATLQWAESTE